MTRGAIVGVALAALAAGCASVPEGAPAINGRLSVQVAALGDAPARGFHAAFELRGDGERGSLGLSTPLGPQIAVARWAPGDVRLETGDGTRRYPTLSALSMDLMHESLPLHALPDWLHGRPWPDAPHATTERGFTQLGWDLDLSGRDTGFVVARRDAAPAVVLRVRLAEDTR